MDEYIQRVVDQFKEMAAKDPMPHVVAMEVTYCMPDFQSILQQFIWHFDDYVPDYPRVNQFVRHWRDNIEAEIQKVRVAPVARLPYEIEIPAHGILLGLDGKPLSLQPN